MKRRVVTGAAKLTCLIAGILLGLIHMVSATLTIQIVNDSGLSDTNIYLMVPGGDGAVINPQSLFVNKNSGTNTAVPLSSLAVNGTTPPFQITSPVSGTTDTVYSFQADYIKSGGIYFIYNHPFTFKNGTTPSPSPDGGNGGSAYRYDYAELSFLGGNANNDVDLTYVDKFGIPLQLEWFHGTNTAATNLIAGSYVYASTKTLADLFAANGFADAVFSLTNAGAANGNITPGWQYTGPDSYSNFARIVSPEKVSGTGASVSPYPGATNYLNFLVDHPFVLNGSSVQGGSVSGGSITTNYLYYYLGYQVAVATNNNGGWTFTMSYDPNLMPTNANLTAIGATTNSGKPDVVDIPVQYTNTISFTVPDTNTTICAGAFIYGAPVGTNYSVNGTPVTDVTHTSYNVEAWMIGDVLSSLNFGFAGGIYGTNSDQWFSPKVAWTSYPFGWAQPSPYNNPTNGYYNPYAALMYYTADAYTFAFSERITPDVGMAVGSNDVVRITILPDDRLDSPVPEVQTNLTMSNSITLNWNPVAGATGYRVNMLRPLGIPSADTTSTRYTFNGLIPGAPYVMSVQAMGTNNGNPVITPARPITATTTGDYTETNGNFIQIQAALDGVVDPFSQLKAAFINGIELTPQTNGSWEAAGGGYASWMAWQGTNQVVVKLIDQNSNVVFDDWATFVLSPPFMSNGTNYTTISDIHFYGQLTGTTPTFVGDPNVHGNNIPTNDTSGVIGLLYVPAEIRKSDPLNAITPAPSTVTITGVASLLGGGIRFDFNVPEGTNYVIESSGNLIDWQTNSIGIGLAGGEESYTNTVGTNAVQFYRIKL